GDHPPNAGALADRPGLPIILRLEPSLNLLERSKLDDHEALRHPIPFEDPHGAAACKEPPAVTFDAGTGHRAVLRRSYRIRTRDIHDHICRHGSHNARSTTGRDGQSLSSWGSSSLEP